MPDAVSTGVDGVTSVLDGRSESLVILVGIIILAGLYIWFVVVPSRKDDSEAKKLAATQDAEHKRRQDEIQMLQAKSIESLASVTKDTHVNSKITKTNTQTIIEAIGLEYRALRKINDTIEGVDISDELSKGEGLLEFAKRQ